MQLQTNEQVLTAYSDSRDDISEDEGYRLRSMYCLGEPMSVTAWLELMSKATPGGYNNFDARNVATALMSYDNQITLQPAREYSVACYVRGEPDALAAIAKIAKRKLMADEVMYQERIGQPDGDRGQWRDAPGECLRLWWD